MSCLRLLLIVMFGAVIACSSGSAGLEDELPAPDEAGLDDLADSPFVNGARNWAMAPAIMSVPPPKKLFAVSDVHGGYDRVVTLLQAAGIATVSDKGAVTWTAGDSVLVVVGDSIDKGDRSIAVLDLWMALQKAASTANGKVVVLLGNHEAEFLANQEIDKSQALRDEIAKKKMSPEKFASLKTRWGRFLRSMPIAAVVAGWYFSHAGHNASRTMDTLKTEFAKAVDEDRWGDPILADDDSPLEANDWWSESVIASDLAAASAAHLVMGHDPHAFGEDGRIGAHFQGRLVHIDTGLSPAVDYSKGFVLRVDAPGTLEEAAFAVSHTGESTALDMKQP